ncbi:MAG: helix-turn-helix transcriptional regulator [Clostridiales bacterium]|nr:helix-turn-helix transcriptional regulator [Clostridiales bacterium]
MSTKEHAPAANGDQKEADVLYDSDPVLVYIRTRIEELCAKKDISKYRLERRSGVSASNINRYIEGSRIPTVETLAKLCTGFDMTLSEFFENLPGCEHPASDDPREILLEIWEKLDQSGQKSMISFGRFLVDSEENQ